MKRLRRVVSLMLAFAFILITVGRTAIVANADDNYGTVVYDENGTKYVIKTFVYDDCRKVVTTNCDSKDKIEFVVDNDYEELIITNYDYQGKNIFGIDKYTTEENSVQICCDEDDNDNITSQYSWGKKRYEKWSKKDRFWYQLGASDYGNDYMQIGCKAKYRIKYWDLSSKKQDKCDKYVSAIKSCNRNLAMAEAEAGGAGVLEAIVIAIGITAATCPPATIVPIVIGIVGGCSLAVKDCYDAYCDYRDIEDLYAVIKKYGYEI